MSFETDKDNSWYLMDDEELESELAGLDILDSWKEENQSETLRKKKESREILTDLLLGRIEYITPTWRSINPFETIEEFVENVKTHGFTAEEVARISFIKKSDFYAWSLRESFFKHYAPLLSKQEMFIVRPTFYFDYDFPVRQVGEQTIVTNVFLFNLIYPDKDFYEFYDRGKNKFYPAHFTY